jgi:hypothetical protein
LHGLCQLLLPLSLQVLDLPGARYRTARLNGDSTLEKFQPDLSVSLLTDGQQLIVIELRHFLGVFE